MYREGTTLSQIKMADDLGPEWKEVVGDRDLYAATAVEYGFAEEVITFLEFMDGSYEVGRGEAMRPYLCLYTGTELEAATKAFLQEIQRGTFE